MEAYLMVYISYQEHNRAPWLPMAEFTPNNIISEATAVSPFYANYGFNPRFSVELTSTPSEPEKHNTQKFGIHINTLHEFLQTEMRYAQD